MDKILEILRTVKQYFHLLLGISATGIALLLSPKEVNYSGQFDELNTLINLNPIEFEKYTRGFIGSNSLLPYENWAEWENGIVNQLRKGYIQRNEYINLVDGEKTNLDWNISPIITYEQPPIDGSLKDWEKWIKSKNSAEYYTPDWSTAKTSMSRGVGNELIIVRNFLLQQSEMNKNLGAYSYRAYLDKEIKAIDTSEYPMERSKRWDWWSRFDTIPYRNLFVDKTGLRDSIDNEKRFLIEGEVDSKLPIKIGTSIYDWLKQSKYWVKLSKTDGLGESILPELHSVWSEVSDKTLNDARIFLTNKRNESKTISLIGISVSYLLAILIVPLAYFLVSLYLLLHLKYLDKKLLKITEPVIFPWIGLYNYKLAKFVTLLTFIIIPFGLCFGIIIRYGNMVDKGLLLVSIMLTFLVLWIGVLIERQNMKIRNTLKTYNNNE